MSGRLLLFLLAVLGAGVLAAMASRDPGYVLVIWQQTSVETSLWMALLLVLVAGLLLRWLAAMLALLLSGPAGWRSWRNRRRHARYCADADGGRRALLEGHWKTAHKRLLAATRRSDRPIDELLAAARAAAAQGEPAEADRLLDQARALQPDLDLGTELLRAELLLQAGDATGARRLLDALEATDAQNPRRLQLLAEVLVAVADGRALMRLLPELERRKVFLPARLQLLQQLVDRMTVSTVSSEEPDGDSDGHGRDESAAAASDTTGQDGQTSPRGA